MVKVMDEVAQWILSAWILVRLVFVVITAPVYSLMYVVTLASCTVWCMWLMGFRYSLVYVVMFVSCILCFMYFVLL